VRFPTSEIRVAGSIRSHPMNQFFAPLTEPVGAIWGLMVLGVVWLLHRREGGRLVVHPQSAVFYTDNNNP
jgi:uncharacterized protein (TIGR03382 family)